MTLRKIVQILTVLLLLSGCFQDDEKIAEAFATLGQEELTEYIEGISASRIRDYKSKRNHNIIHAAVANRENPHAIEIAARFQPNINQRDNNGRTPLHYAIYADRIEATRILLNLGARTNIPNDAGDTALYSCFDIFDIDPNHEACKLVVDQKKGLKEVAQGSQQKERALSENSNSTLSKLKCFLFPNSCHKENVEDKTYGMSLAMAFSNFGPDELVEYLSQTEPSTVSSYLSDGGANIIHFAATNRYNISAIEKAFEYGVDINNENKYGKTPLLHAIYLDRAKSAIKLLELGADPHLKNNRGYDARLYCQRILKNSPQHQTCQTIISYLSIQNSIGEEQ